MWPEPTRAQSALEAAVFFELNTLHASEIDTFLDDEFAVRAVWPEPDRITLDVESHTIVKRIARLLPCIGGDDGAIRGVAGLRVEQADNGVLFRAVGAPGAVVFEGVTDREVLREVNRLQRIAASGHDELQLSHPRSLAGKERRAIDEQVAQSGDLARIASCVIRRMGVFTSIGATDIRLWPDLLRPRDALNVEVGLSSIAALEVDEAMRFFCSALQPVLTPHEKGPALEGYYNYFALGTATLNLRIRYDRPSEREIVEKVKV